MRVAIHWLMLFVVYTTAHVYSDKDEKSNNSGAAGSGDAAFQETQVKASSIASSDSTLKGNKKALKNGTLSDVVQRYLKSQAPAIEQGSKKVTIAAAATSLLKNSDVQEKVVEKGLEVAGKLVDKQMQIIDEAQEKAENFLKKEIKLNIVPDQGWQTEDMFVPPGYHIDGTIEGDDKSPKESGGDSYTFPGGIGSVMMNGCWGTGYTYTDPCYNSKWNTTICDNMIDGAAFIGVGFDGRGEYSPDSRKMSIVQRTCVNRASYDGFEVPDTMNVHGVYDTRAFMTTFEGREEYQKYLQTEAGMSGSYFGFYAGVKAAYGESSTKASQKYMAVMDVDIDRYEIFMDEVKPGDLSVSFFKEYMALCESYYAAGCPVKFQDFIQRWGTHYIKSAKFGGRMEIKKTMAANSVQDKTEFATEMEMEFKSLFASFGAKHSASGGEQQKKQSKTTSTSVAVQGGSQEIASILSDVYSPTFKNEFKDWLKSIPDYPKAFQFLMSPITDLVNFRASDLFPNENVDWGCEGHVKTMRSEIEPNGEEVRYYETDGANGVKKKNYCPFADREALDLAIRRRRSSLKRAIEIYMEEGPISISDVRLKPCPTEDDDTEPRKQEDFWKPKFSPSWKEIVEGKVTFKVEFDMKEDLTSSSRGGTRIAKNMVREMRYNGRKWYITDEKGFFHMFNAFDNDGSGNPKNRKISIFGLVLTYDDKEGGLFLTHNDYTASKKVISNLSTDLIGVELARTEIRPGEVFRRTNQLAESICHVHWSNALRFDPTDKAGKCLHFTASTAGDVYVIFSALPSKRETWYVIKIGPSKIAISKGDREMMASTDSNALSLGDPILYQSYFNCISERQEGTVIEYGKSLGTSDSGDVYLNLVDSDRPLNVRFYAFGSGNHPVVVMDAHLVSRRDTKAECKGQTMRDLPTNLCVQRCHESCDPFAGCTSTGGEPKSTECKACRTARDQESNECIEECPENTIATEDKVCKATFDFVVTSTNYGWKAKSYGVTQLSEFTLCAWIKFPSSKSTGQFQIMAYTTPRLESDFYMTILVQDRTLKTWGEAAIIHNNDWQKEEFDASELKDLHWHQVCLTWSGKTGLITPYIDGKKKSENTASAKRVLNGGGHVSLLGTANAAIQLTEFNLWDEAFSGERLVEMSTDCYKGRGNVLEWFHFASSLKTHSALYQTPSTCSASARPETGAQ